MQCVLIYEEFFAEILASITLEVDFSVCSKDLIAGRLNYDPVILPLRILINIIIKLYKFVLAYLQLNSKEMLRPYIIICVI